jgi:beta-lactamase regulating signal transducer with metallopeptidase domain
MMTWGSLSAEALTGGLGLLGDVVLLKGAILVGLGIVASHVLRSRSAATRHGVWVAVMVGLLMAPVLRTVGSTWAGSRLVEIQALVPMSDPVPVEQNLSRPVAGPASPVSRLEALPRPEPAAQPPPAPLTYRVGTWFEGVVLVWLLGFVAMVSHLACGLARAARLRVRARPAPARMTEQVASAGRVLGVRTTPAVLLSDELVVPGALGSKRPCVLLPIEAVDWPVDRLNAVLLHELSHVRRHDFAVHLLASIVRAFYWMNPMVWLAERQLVLERELACDDRVIAGQGDPVGYAAHLVGVARLVRGPVPASAALPFSSRSGLAGRIGAILDDARSRSPLRRGGLITLAVLTGLVAIPMAAVEILAVSQHAASPQVAGLEDEDPLVRRHSAWSLGELEDPKAVGPLIAALSDDDARVRTMAAWALGEIKDPGAAPALVAALDDDDTGVREMAVLALGELNDPSVAEALEWAAETRPLEGPARWALAEMDDHDPPEVWAGRLHEVEAGGFSLEQALGLLASDDPAVRAQAAEVLGRLGDPAAVDAPMDALDDPAPEVRAMAVWALDEINPSRGAGTPR